jgi:hypothetical protein
VMVSVPYCTQGQPSHGQAKSKADASGLVAGCILPEARLPESQIIPCQRLSSAVPLQVSWMPLGVDWTSAFRICPAVAEYIMVHAKCKRPQHTDMYSCAQSSRLEGQAVAYADPWSIKCE